MKTTLSDNIVLLNKDGEKILNMRFSILFSINRNRYLSFMKNYIAFYNGYRSKVLVEYKEVYAEQLPELEFKDYTLSLRFQVLLILTFPISFWIFIQQWNYIKNVQKDLQAGLATINKAVKKPMSKNTNFTPPKIKRK